MQRLNIPEGLHIRPSRETDKPFLEKLHHAARQDLQLIDGEKEFIESIVEMQFRAQTEGYGSQFPDAMYFIIEKHHEPIGRAAIDFGHNEAHLLDIAFLPQARGHGFGKAIIQSFQMAAAQSGLPVSLNVLQGNWGAKQLYLSLGFVVEAARPPYEEMRWYPQGMRAFSGI
ncbi:Acetyltransferase (GNAT) family protein [Vibrio aerogenes CECT 7868]|uniref:Acetyltransferase (GNAT) family protein n=1 Tax=Vibrio aerogenes CECT 7868 TaxID=1216006 RepID=A0A1M6C109_9VIBR|nr:GNAT family N-acetyltransferase [Vibrio aerogenes]SHI54414.1 Acetyltransferase (GNAT) family protein [Vibrio aerogenes CECT 7868]